MLTTEPFCFCSFRETLLVNAFIYLVTVLMMMMMILIKINPFTFFLSKMLFFLHNRQNSHFKYNATEMFSFYPIKFRNIFLFDPIEIYIFRFSLFHNGSKLSIIGKTKSTQNSTSKWFHWSTWGSWSWCGPISTRIWTKIWKCVYGKWQPADKRIGYERWQRIWLWWEQWLYRWLWSGNATIFISFCYQYLC